jgi:hypothetical protein
VIIREPGSKPPGPIRSAKKIQPALATTTNARDRQTRVPDPEQTIAHAMVTKQQNGPRGTDQKNGD